LRTGVDRHRSPRRRPLGHLGGRRRGCRDRITVHQRQGVDGEGVAGIDRHLLLAGGQGESAVAARAPDQRLSGTQVGRAGAHRHPDDLTRGGQADPGVATDLDDPVGVRTGRRRREHLHLGDPR